VSSGALDQPLTYRLSDDPYPALLPGRIDPSRFITPGQVASAIADAAELDVPPLRIPIGAPGNGTAGRAQSGTRGRQLRGQPLVDVAKS
jgi:hypothetical protein